MDKDYLLKKWLNDELSDTEKEAFLQSDDYSFYKDIIDNANHFKASNFSKAEDFETFNAKYQSQKPKVKKLKWLNPLLRVASIVVIGFALYFTIFQETTIEIQTLAHEQTTIELPDASIVTLNAKSQVSYDKKAWSKHREIKLAGEAFFIVSKGNTFDVITKDGKVTVVGTQFNVKQRDNYFEVKCFEGVVKVTSQFITKTLNAGDTYRFLDNEFSESKTILKEPQWTKNKSSFESVPLKEVIAELERQYDIKITTKQLDGSRLFTGVFTHNNLENALMSVSQPMNLTYEINTANQVVIHGNKR
jgi:ferric-dicitrate binding protein FerR (iron transport regulator)